MGWDDWKPSLKRIAVLSGKVRLEDADPAIQSVCSHDIYLGACAVLDLPTREQRRAALARIPELIRPHIEKEALKIHERRRRG